MAWFRKPAPVAPVEQDSTRERVIRAEITYIKATERFVAEGDYEAFQHDTNEWLKDMPWLPLHEGIVRAAFAVSGAMQRRHEVEMHSVEKVA